MLKSLLSMLIAFGVWSCVIVIGPTKSAGILQTEKPSQPSLERDLDHVEALLQQCAVRRADFLVGNLLQDSRLSRLQLHRIRQMLERARLLCRQACISSDDSILCVSHTGNAGNIPMDFSGNDSPASRESIGE